MYLYFRNLLQCLKLVFEVHLQVQIEGICRLSIPQVPRHIANEVLRQKLAHKYVIWDKYFRRVFLHLPALFSCWCAGLCLSKIAVTSCPHVLFEVTLGLWGLPDAPFWVWEAECCASLILGLKRFFLCPPPAKEVFVHSLALCIYK